MGEYIFMRPISEKREAYFHEMNQLCKTNTEMVANIHTREGTI